MSFFTAQLAEKAKKIEILHMDEEDEHSLSEFYITLKNDMKLLMQKLKQASPEKEAIDDFINQQESAITNKRTVTAVNTLIRYMEANGMKNEKIESLPASELDFLLPNFFLNAHRKTEKNKITSQQKFPKIPQSRRPSGNERTRITILIGGPALLTLK